MQKKSASSFIPKDPNAPRRPISSFFIFAMENRSKIAAENPNLSYKDIQKLISQMWETADKRPYEEKAAKKMEDFRRTMADYKASTDASNTSVLSPTPNSNKESQNTLAIRTEKEMPPKKKKKNPSMEVPSIVVSTAVVAPSSDSTVFTPPPVQSPITAAANHEKTKKRDKKRESSSKTQEVFM